MRSNTFVKLLFVILIVCLCITFTNSIPWFGQARLEHFQKKPTIWMYWETPAGKTKPVYLDLCYETIVKHCNTHFDIRLLNETTISRFLPTLPERLHQKLPTIPQRTDYYRVKLLYLYGGIWLDADTIVFKSLYPLIQKLNEYNFVGFGCYNYPSNKNVVQDQCKPVNGALVTKPKSALFRLYMTRIESLLAQTNRPLTYHRIGRTLMNDCIEEIRRKNSRWKYYHVPSQCLERDFKQQKIVNTRLVSTEKMESECVSKRLFLPVYNTAPGFPKWFLKLTREEILRGPYLMSQYFRHALNIDIPHANNPRTNRPVNRSSRGNAS